MVEIPLNPLNLQAIEAYLKANLGDDHGGMEMREMADLVLERIGGNDSWGLTMIENAVLRTNPSEALAALLPRRRDLWPAEEAGTAWSLRQLWRRSSRDRSRTTASRGEPRNASRPQRPAIDPSGRRDAMPRLRKC